MSDASDRISELFTVSSRDMTPASAGHAACVLYAPVSRNAEVSRHCASVLSDAELQRRDRFAAERDKARFEQRRAFRRFCGATALGSSQPLSEIVFEETQNGRPYLPESPDFWFSFSSCQFGLLGAWSSTHAIGVDLEDQTRDLEARELARQFFSVAEAFEFELDPRLRVVHAPPGHGGPERFSAHAIEGTDSYAALVIRSWA
jgi:hypothetical protein